MPRGIPNKKDADGNPVRKSRRRRRKPRGTESGAPKPGRNRRNRRKRLGATDQAVLDGLVGAMTGVDQALAALGMTYYNHIKRSGQE